MTDDVNNNVELGNNSDITLHCHTNDKKGIDKLARNRLIFASVLCITFMAAEIVGGVLANSLAIASDAAHLLTDFASFMISLLALWLGSRPATNNMNFGWYRAEVIGALCSVLLIWVVTAILVYIAVERLTHGEYEIDALIMIITAALGILINILMGASLHFSGISHGHSHGSKSHGHSHENKNSHQHNGHNHEENDGNNDEKAKHNHKEKANINVRAAFIHVIGDLFQSIGVLIAAIVIYYKPNWKFIDPICTFVFSIIVLAITFNIMKDTINIIMEGSPKGINFSEVKQVLHDIPGVVRVHHLRIWSLSLDKTALASHLVIGETDNQSLILNKALKSMKERFNVHEAIIQVEIFNDEMKSCSECQQHL